MSHEGEPDNMSEDEKTFRKEFFDMKRMLKFHYEERSKSMQGERSNIPKGDKSSKGEEGDGDKPPKGNGNGDKQPLTPPFSSTPSSPSSSSTTSPSQTPPHSPKGHGKTPFLKLNIKFDLYMYDGGRC